jgi:hypothetical protein
MLPDDTTDQVSITTAMCRAGAQSAPLAGESAK